MRKANTNKRGGAFDSATIEAVWRKGQIVIGHDSTKIRKDSCGAFIVRSEYGNTNSKFGWEIDHIKPVSNFGTDDLSNLQPLQWENNRHKGDNWPHWSCKVKAA